MFRNVTHLEVLDLSGTFNDYACTQIARIPNLTHLSFRVGELYAQLVPVLCASPQLQGLVVLCSLNEKTVTKRAGEIDEFQHLIEVE
ncbi:hypothetical protein B0H19DRAFT_1255386 [Mycena capillaripes]|nr:hypothetical protein B0H19DRAFT_1255386 [Mycena capillaripes]